MKQIVIYLRCEPGEFLIMYSTQGFRPELEMKFTMRAEGGIILGKTGQKNDPFLF